MSWCPFAKKMELQPESDTQAAITPTQFILHSIAAPWTIERVYEFWRDSTNLESHFGLGYDGRLGQYIGTNTRADANAQANPRAISLESASNLQHTDPWTDEQIETLVRVMDWAATEHGIPRRKCRSWTDPGFGYHRMFPEWSTGGTACPGDARVRQFNEIILPRVIAGDTTPDPVPPPEEEAVPVPLTGSNPIDVALDSGEWVALALDADGGHILTGPTGPVSILVHTYFDVATPADTKIQGKFYLTNTDGTSPSDYLVTDKRGGGGHQFLHATPVPSGKRLWFAVRAVPADGTSTTSLLHRDFKGHYWTV